MNKIKKKEVVKALFTRKSTGINPERVVNINDDNAILKLIDDLDRNSLLKGFNPETDVIVLKSELEAFNEIKTLTADIKYIKDYVQLVRTDNVKRRDNTVKEINKEEKSIRRIAKLTQPKRRF